MELSIVRLSKIEMAEASWIHGSWFAGTGKSVAKAHTSTSRGFLEQSFRPTALESGDVLRLRAKELKGRCAAVIPFRLGKEFGREVASWVFGFLCAWRFGPV